MNLPLRVLVAHPSPDLYGSDLQLLESITALTEAGMNTLTAIPLLGPLAAEIEKRGGSVIELNFPVLRKATLSSSGIGKYLRQNLSSLLVIRGLMREYRPDVVYVNTMTVPTWILAAAIARKPAVCHVHEAPAEASRLVRTGLMVPLLFCKSILVNSKASLSVITRTIPNIKKKTRVIYNGIKASTETFEEVVRNPDAPTRVVLVGRLSPRKGTDVALRAVELLRRDGYEVSLELCGTSYEGYEWFEQDLKRMASNVDLLGAVTFRGYVSPSLDALRSADIAVVPSLQEPFGNTAVEAQLSRRPVIASDVQGLREIVEHGKTGLLCIPGDAVDLAEQIARLIVDPLFASKISNAGYESAVANFGLDRYNGEIVAAIVEAAESRRNAERTHNRLETYTPIRMRYLLRLPEVKRFVLRIATNKIASLPGIPRSMRAYALRKSGIEIGNAKVGHSVRFDNTNIVFGNQVEIGAGVHFEGSGRIVIGHGSTIGPGAILTTRSTDASTGVPTSMEFDKILIIAPLSTIGRGDLVSPYKLSRPADQNFLIGGRSI